MSNHSLKTRLLQPEVMDDPQLDKSRHFGALKSLAAMNWLSASSSLVWRAVAAYSDRHPRHRVRILDIATGSGDIPIGLSHRAERTGIDVEVSIECLAHVEDKAKYFQEVERVLKPGSRAAITAWLTCSHPSKWSQRHLLEPICREGRLPAMGSAEEYERLIEATGLRVVEYRDLSPKVSKTWRICARRVGWMLMTSFEAWRFLLAGKTSHSIFMVTILRILLAYRFREMIYGYFILEKPKTLRDE